MAIIKGDEEATMAFARMAAEQAVKEMQKEAARNIAEHTKMIHDSFMEAGFTEEQAFELTTIMLENEALQSLHLDGGE